MRKRVLAVAAGSLGLAVVVAAAWAGTRGHATELQLTASLSSAEEAIQSGRTYVNVHTPTNGDGEIRGQVAVRASLRAVLGARQEVPRPRGRVGRAQGTFTGTLTKSGATGRLAWRLTFSRLTGRAVAAHIHIARRGRPGPVALALCGPCRNGARGTGTVPATLIAALDAGRAYVNIHTRRNAAGEIRGQIPATPLVMSP